MSWPCPSAGPQTAVRGIQPCPLTWRPLPLEFLASGSISLFLNNLGREPIDSNTARAKARRGCSCLSETCHDSGDQPIIRRNRLIQLDSAPTHSFEAKPPVLDPQSMNHGIIPANIPTLPPLKTMRLFALKENNTIVLHGFQPSWMSSTFSLSPSHETCLCFVWKCSPDKLPFILQKS